MQNFKQYSNHLFLVMLFVATVFVAGCGGSSNDTAAVTEVTATPTANTAVIPTVPTSDSTGVTTNAKSITAFSDKALDASTVNSNTFTLTNGTTAVPGTVTYVGKTMLFNPNLDLPANTKYTATITTGILDISGVPLLNSNKVWSFTTGDTPDIIAPTVKSIYSATNTINIPIDRIISVIFSEALDPSTVNASTFKLVTATGSTPVDGSVYYKNNTMFFNTSVHFTPSTKYTGTVTTGVTDLAGNHLAVNEVWSFTTGVAPDITAPTVKSTYPDTNALNVPTDRIISVVFSEALNSSTVNTSTFKLATTIGSTPVNGTVSYANDTMVFNHAASLVASTKYTATITTGVTDLVGNHLAVNRVWSFTTAGTIDPVVTPVVDPVVTPVVDPVVTPVVDPVVASGPSPVNLGTAGNFAILTKTGISTTGTTSITGDIGVSPIALTAVTGFSDTLFSDGTYATSPLVTGKIYAANLTSPTPSNMTTAVSDMETAYTDAAGRTTPDYTELYAGDVSGKVLTPGLYKWGTGVLVTNAGVTISGGATDVWIFQIAGDLTLDNGAIITLAGGALAKNIFWQVAGGTGVSLGTTSQFKGIVLAQKGIVVNTGATVNGRLLAQSAVTLNANAVTQP